MKTFFHVFTILLDTVLLLGFMFLLAAYINKKFLEKPENHIDEEGFIKGIYDAPMVTIKWTNPRIEFGDGEVCSIVGKAIITKRDDDGIFLSESDEVSIMSNLPIVLTEEVTSLELTLHYGNSDSLSYTNYEQSKVDVQIM